VDVTVKRLVTGLAGRKMARVDPNPDCLGLLEIEHPIIQAPAPRRFEESSRSAASILAEWHFRGLQTPLG
jgi:hypothetical protein